MINRRSIAYSIAERALEEGAEVLLTSFGRVRRITERAARGLPGPPEVLELDVNSDPDLEALAAELEQRWGRLDGAVHAVALRPARRDRRQLPQRPARERQAGLRDQRLLAEGAGRGAPAVDGAGGQGRSGGSIVGLDFDASVAWPVYDWMGVSKAALESVSRYLARELGPRGVRVNLISAGPLATAAASGIEGFSDLSRGWGEAAPLGWDPADPAPVADAAIFLLSPLARGISGEIVHVDGGFHAVGAVAP